MWSTDLLTLPTRRLASGFSLTHSTVVVVVAVVGVLVVVVVVVVDVVFVVVVVVVGHTSRIRHVCISWCRHERMDLSAVAVAGLACIINSCRLPVSFSRHVLS
ncbi:unnamed protein product [Polarella glacialis]|uniref:Uncharacterized protein n=1 Tax=Polarella glacialis TaxID=89957 RepID=A0A813IE64_POLGL|nr:unnamed protein product [Polarella glacialis]CAE8649117.1 unnamed protein product [Polarella glacialis]CAE8701978.1 unnamed protein product [Polarella glacialis]